MTETRACRWWSPGGGFAEPGGADHLIDGKTVCFPAAKQSLHQRQRLLFNALTTAIHAEVLRLQLVERIDVLLIDDFPFPLLIVKLDKALKRLAQPLPGDGLKDIVEGAVADGQAAGFHIAGGGDKDH